jgi:2-amino-4-hydroxy-6-hydroxymethyldihydropteridine diphosphokinase
MGANLASREGLPEATLVSAAERLRSLGRIVRRSSLYSTEPVGFARQPHFINAVVALETGLPPRTLMSRLLHLERDFGRDRIRSQANGPRTLDLDILLLGDLCIYEAGLEVPHPRLAERAFVLVPLNEIAPDAIVPNLHVSVAQLHQRLRDTHDVVRTESEAWRSSAGGDADASGGVLPAGQPHDHRRG